MRLEKIFPVGVHVILSNRILTPYEAKTCGKGYLPRSSRYIKEKEKANKISHKLLRVDYSI
jgi:hypothetical protein